MVCMGNTCRSPIAEAVFRDVLEKKGLSDKWFVDSAATRDYHTGKSPNIRAQVIMAKHDIKLSHVARTLSRDDFQKFDYIFGMDYGNIRDIESEAPSDSKAVIKMITEYDPEDKSPIRDPYCDRGSEGFEIAYVRSLRCAHRFLESLV